MGVKAAQRGQIPPFYAVDVMRIANERAASGREVFHLEAGQPGTPAPAGVRGGRSGRDGRLAAWLDAFQK